MRRIAVPTAVRRASLALPLLAALLAAGCGQRPKAAAPERTSSFALQIAPAADLARSDASGAVASAEAVAGGEPSAPVSGAPPSVVGRMLIRNVSLMLVVADVDSAGARVERLIAARGGFVASSSLEDRGGFPWRSYTLRVPSDRLDATLADLRAFAVKVTAESQNVQDVTDQAVDVQARLRTLRATEEELIGLLKDARARGQKAEDVMAIYRELTGIRTQIEQYQGQLQSLQNLAALSTISLSLAPDAATGPLQPQGWRPGETVKNSLRQLIGALRGLGDFVIWAAIVLVPLALAVGVAVALLGALLRRFRVRGPWNRHDD